MKTVITLIIAFAAIAINGVYFEFCVSRSCPMMIITFATFLLILLDLWMLWQFVELLKNALNFNSKTTKKKKQKSV